MRIYTFFLPAKIFFTRLAQWPQTSGVGVLGVVFGLYLYTNDYQQNYYDAQGYWELANQYWSTGEFNFLSYDSFLRGYLFPLLLSPLTLLTAYWGWNPLDIARAVGLCTAVTFFGVVGPGLWGAVRGPQFATVLLGRRLVFGLLGFVLWRGYFNFSLTDFPALLALLTGLWGLLRGRSVGSGLLAGLAVAAAVNFRPVYVAALPFAGLLCLLPRSAVPNWQPRQLQEWARRFAFAAGICLVMYPQQVINKAHYGVRSPLVLTALPGSQSLYLSQLQWGLVFQRYETNVGTDYPKPEVYFQDEDGKALSESVGFQQLDSYTQYFTAVYEYPTQFLGLFFRHFFNALDLQHPTPFLQSVYTATWPLALLNYVVLLGSVLTMFGLGRKRFSQASIPALLVLFALLAPCAATLPVVIECRFLMPLHLLLCAAVAFASHPWQAWQATSVAKRAIGLSLFAMLVAGCFALSMKTHRQLLPTPRRLFDWQSAAPKPW